MGYAGGTKKDPSYHDLGDHSETIQIDYDPARISYRELLGIFWESHDPTAMSWSRQYMSAVSYHNEEQRNIIVETRVIEESKCNEKIVTEVIPFSEFYPAEDYHQKHALLHHHDFLTEFRFMYPLFADIVYSTAAARVNGYLGGYGEAENLRIEVDSYGLSQETGKRLLDIVVSAHRHHCIRSGPC